MKPKLKRNLSLPGKSVDHMNTEWKAMTNYKQKYLTQKYKLPTKTENKLMRWEFESFGMWRRWVGGWDTPNILQNPTTLIFGSSQNIRDSAQTDYSSRWRHYGPLTRQQPFTQWHAITPHKAQILFTTDGRNSTVAVYHMNDFLFTKVGYMLHSLVILYQTAKKWATQQVTVKTQ
jgi:hypothetical protein